MAEQMTLGALLKQEGQERVRANTPETWAEACDEAIRKCAAKPYPFTAEDVRSACGDPPNHVNALPARIGAHANHGCIRPDGFAYADRPSAHRRVIRLWIGTGKGCGSAT